MLCAKKGLNMKMLKKFLLSILPLAVAALTVPALADAPAPNFIERNADWLLFLIIGIALIALAVLIVCLVRSKKRK